MLSGLWRSESRPDSFLGIPDVGSRVLRNAVRQDIDAVRRLLGRRLLAVAQIPRTLDDARNIFSGALLCFGFGGSRQIVTLRTLAAAYFDHLNLVLVSEFVRLGYVGAAGDRGPMPVFTRRILGQPRARHQRGIEERGTGPAERLCVWHARRAQRRYSGAPRRAAGIILHSVQAGQDQLRRRSWLRRYFRFIAFQTTFTIVPHRDFERRH